MDEQTGSIVSEPGPGGAESDASLDPGQAAEWLEHGRGEPEAEHAAQGEPDHGTTATGEYAEIIQRLQALGATPELLREALNAYQQPEGPTAPFSVSLPEPQVDFGEWVAGQGVRLEECTLAEQLALRSAFQSEQTLRAFEQQARQAQQQALTSQWSSELQSVRDAYAEFRDPDLARDLLSRWVEMPDDVSISEVAESMRQRWITAYRNHLSTQAIRDGQPSSITGRPAMRGGGVPPVSESPDVTRMNDDEFERFIRSELETLGRAAR